MYVCVCERKWETQVQPIIYRFLSASGCVSTNHKVNIRPATSRPPSPNPGRLHLLNSPIKAGAGGVLPERQDLSITL